MIIRRSQQYTTTARLTTSRLLNARAVSSLRDRLFMLNAHSLQEWSRARLNYSRFVCWLVAKRNRNMPVYLKVDLLSCECWHTVI